MTKKEQSPELKNVKFEDALKNLEKIVEKLEGGDVPLEESLSLYEEGITLFKHCSLKLEEAKKKVEILSKKGNSDTMETEPFRPEKQKGNLSEDSDLSSKEEIPF
ncbi:MAG: exodeoxyribonuclease VII small subunit [Elusimicrobia bacterium]|nr:exodeoxyribonuclease VII small subunit [Elusimicrobiota bacterium]